MGHTSTIQSRLLLRIQKIIGESALVIKGPQGRINRTVWGPLNRTIISVGEDTIVRVWDSKTGKLLIESEKEVGHKKTIISLTKSVDGSQFITGSLDKSAKVVNGDGTNTISVGGFIILAMKFKSVGSVDFACVKVLQLNDFSLE
ncbi:hypothetical protein CsatA_026065 [Cannabis sativa]